MNAFPNPNRTDQTGMTLRDYFAAQAIGVTAPNKPPAYDDTTIAKYAYEMADAMLKAREA